VVRNEAYRNGETGDPNSLMKVFFFGSLGCGKKKIDLALKCELLIAPVICSDWPFSTAFEASMLRPINFPVMQMWSRVTPMNAIHEKRFIV